MVPLEHIYTLAEYPYGSPTVGDRVTVMNRNKLGRMSKWPRIVVSENDVATLLYVECDPAADSPRPPGSVSSTPSKRQPNSDNFEPAKKPRTRQQGA